MHTSIAEIQGLGATPAAELLRHAGAFGAGSVLGPTQTGSKTDLMSAIKRGLAPITEPRPRRGLGTYLLWGALAFGVGYGAYRLLKKGT